MEAARLWGNFEEALGLELAYGPVAVNLVASAADRDMMDSCIGGFWSKGVPAETNELILPEALGQYQLINTSHMQRNGRVGGGEE